VFKSGDSFESVPSNQGDFTLPNGLAFNKEQSVLYWNDLMERVIKQFDFDLGTGTLCKLF
jgi:sugar lactone lactonase YvrE